MFHSFVAIIKLLFSSSVVLTRGLQINKLWHDFEKNINYTLPTQFSFQKILMTWKRYFKIEFWFIRYTKSCIQLPFCSLLLWCYTYIVTIKNVTRRSPTNNGFWIQAHGQPILFVSTETKYPDITDQSQLIVLEAAGNLRLVANMLSLNFS